MASLLTTKDNPYDPYNDFGKWYSYDEMKGYHSCSLLARIAKTSDHLSDEANENIIDDAINEIIKYDTTGKYKKVVV